MTDPPQGQGSWKPVPDPTVLTTEQLRRELDVAVSAIHREVTAATALADARMDSMDMASVAQTEAGKADTLMHLRARELEITGLRDVIFARLAAMEKATDARLAAFNLMPDHLHAEREAAISHLREIIDTRLDGMDKATELVALDLRQVPTALDKATGSLKAVLDQRLSGMDKATELLAEDLRQVPTSLDERVRALQALIGERLDAMDRATVLRLSVMDTLPAQVTDEIEQLRKLHEERFNSVGTQFAERDIRTDQASKAAKEALDAALQAAKELVNAQGEASSAAAVKSETSFTKQIDQIGTIISTLEKALDARITELKERIDRGEGTSAGAQSVTGSPFDAASYQQIENANRAQATRAMVTTAISGLAVIITIISVLFAVLHK